MQVDFNSLPAIAQHWSKVAPSRQAVVYGSKVLSYEQFGMQVLRYGGYLKQQGFEAGDRIVYLGRNNDVQLLLFFACAARNLRLVLPNWRLSPRELGELIADARPAAVIASSEVAGLVAGSGVLSAAIVIDSEALEVAVSTSFPVAADIVLAEGEVGKSEDLVLCYTSGSTGRPKGVRLTHGNWLSGIDMASQWSGGNWREESRILCTLPFFHVAGLRSGVLSIAFGGTAVIPQDTSPTALLDFIEKRRVTKMSVVPTLLKTLLETGHDASSKLKSLETIFYGAAPMPAALLARARSLLSCEFVQTYGATETTGVALALDDADHRNDGPRLASCGKTLPSMEICIRNAEGLPAAIGESGHVMLKGPSISPGYWNQPEATKACFLNGWFIPGDLGALDADGFLTLAGRSSDVIKSGGEKVFPMEVENVLLSHPEVEDAAAYGLPDATWGELVAATVVVCEGSSLAPADLIAFCRQNLAAFKCPRRVDFASALPRNSGGKVLRSELKAAHAVAHSGQTRQEACAR